MKQKRTESMADDRHLKFLGVEASNQAKKEMVEEMWDQRPAPQGGGPVDVFVSIELLKIGQVDPLLGTAQVQCDVYLYWHGKKENHLHCSSSF